MGLTFENTDSVVAGRRLNAIDTRNVIRKILDREQCIPSGRVKGYDNFGKQGILMHCPYAGTGAVFTVIVIREARVRLGDATPVHVNAVNLSSVVVVDSAGTTLAKTLIDNGSGYIDNFKAHDNILLSIAWTHYTYQVTTTSHTDYLRFTNFLFATSKTNIDSEYESLVIVPAINAGLGVSVDMPFLNQTMGNITDIMQSMFEKQYYKTIPMNLWQPTPSTDDIQVSFNQGDNIGWRDMLQGTERFRILWTVLTGSGAEPVIVSRNGIVNADNESLGNDGTHDWYISYLDGIGDKVDKDIVFELDADIKGFSLLIPSKHGDKNNILGTLGATGTVNLGLWPVNAIELVISGKNTGLPYYTSRFDSAESRYKSTNIDTNLRTEAINNEAFSAYNVGLSTPAFADGYDIEFSSAIKLNFT